MGDRHSFATKQVLLNARIIAAKTGSQTVDAQHLLLGWLKEPVDPVLPAMADRIRRDLMEAYRGVTPLTYHDKAPLSRDAYGAIEDAEKLRARLGHKAVDPEHLLWGLIRNAPRHAMILLMNEGIDASWVERLLVSEGQHRI